MKELILVILALDVITEIFYIRRLQKERDNAEERAVTHFRRASELEKLNKKYQEEHEILLNNSAELRAKIVDLENNVEFLYNNLTPAKKKLARPDNQN